MEFDQLGDKGFPHGDDATGHRLEVRLPLFKQCRVVEDNVGDSGAVRGRVRNLAALDDGKLAGNVRGRLDGVFRRG